MISLQLVRKQHVSEHSKTELLKNQLLLLKVLALIIHKVKKIRNQNIFDKKIPSQICLCLGFCTADTWSIKHPYRDYHCSKGLSSLLITQVELAYSSLNHVKTFSPSPLYQSPQRLSHQDNLILKNTLIQIIHYTNKLFHFLCKTGLIQPERLLQQRQLL